MKIKFKDPELAIKIIDSVKNPNPISDFDAEKYSKKQIEAMRILTQIPTINKLLPTFNSIVRQNSYLDVPDSVGEMLQISGLVEVEIEDRENESLSKNNIQNENKDLSNERQESIEDKVEEKKRLRNFAKEQEEENNPRVQELNDEIKKIDKEFENANDEKEKEKIIEKEEELAQERDRIAGKYYYLTPERMLQNLKTMSGGRVWNYVIGNGPHRAEKQYAVERAYLTCTDASELNSIDFLEKRIDSFMPNNDAGSGFVGIHKKLLECTYVGYHVEEVSNEASDVKEPDLDDNIKEVTPIMLEFPAFVSELPESLKNEIRGEYYRIIRDYIKDGDNKDNTLIVLSNIEPIIDKANRDLENMQGKYSYSGNAIKAYIKTLDDDFNKDESENGPKTNMELNFSNSEVSTDSQIDDIARLLKSAYSKDQNLPYAGAIIPNVSIDIVINDEADIERLREMVASFAGTVSEVTINYAINKDKGEEFDILQSKIKEINSNSESKIDIQEDTATEKSLETDRVVGNAVESIADAALLSVAVYEIGALSLQEIGKIINSLGVDYARANMNILENSQIAGEVEAVRQGAREPGEAIAYIARLMNVSPQDVEALLEEEINNAEPGLEMPMDINPLDNDPLDNNPLDNNPLSFV